MDNVDPQQIHELGARKAGVLRRSFAFVMLLINPLARASDSFQWWRGVGITFAVLLFLYDFGMHRVGTIVAIVVLALWLELNYWSHRQQWRELQAGTQGPDVGSFHTGILLIVIIFLWFAFLFWYVS